MTSLNYSSMVNESFFLGGGGHVRVLAEESTVTQDRLRGILDPQLVPGTEVGKICVLGGDSCLDSIDPQCAVELVNSIEEDEKKNQSSGLDNLDITRKSRYVVKASAAGERISVEHIEIRKPAGGMSPMRYWEILGSIAREEIPKGKPIR